VEEVDEVERLLDGVVTSAVRDRPRVAVGAIVTVDVFVRAMIANLISFCL
jgi:hypothetical protein